MLRSASRHNPIIASGKRRTSLHTARSAFSGMTLIELLVVLSIISVLAALTMPVLRSARGSAWRTTCLSNEHQATIALTLYADDYNGAFPTFMIDPQSARQSENHLYWHDHFCQAETTDAKQITWASAVMPYAYSAQNVDLLMHGAEEVFRCPADPERFDPLHVSYEYKMGLANGVNEAQVVSPPEAAMLWEKWAFHSDGHESEHDRRARMNVAFVDGHVSWISLADTTTARFGAGPDLHWFFVGSGSTQKYTGRDVLHE